MWADKMANEVIDGCKLLNYDNFAESAQQMTEASISSFLRKMDEAKNIVRLIIR